MSVFNYIQCFLFGTVEKNIIRLIFIRLIGTILVLLVPNYSVDIVASSGDVLIMIFYALLQC